MSGRGRGRGQGSRTPSGARLLLQRSAKEAGLDERNLRSLQDITKPELFPDYEWHSSGYVGHHLNGDEASIAAASSKRTATTVYLINKSREIHQRFQSSPFYVHPTLEVDVVRYGSKRQRFSASVEDDSNISILQRMGKAADPQYVPEELLKISDGTFSKDFSLEDGINTVKRSLEDLAAAEHKQAPNTRIDDADGEEDNLSDVIEAEEDEEEDVDYTTNYYASEDDSDGGGDEAVF